MPITNIPTVTPQMPHEPIHSKNADQDARVSNKNSAFLNISKNTAKGNKFRDQVVAFSEAKEHRG